MMKRLGTSVRFWLGVLAAVVLSANQAAATPFGYASAVDGNLYSVDLATGTPTLIGAMGNVGLMESLAIDAGGNLFGADTGGFLYSINTSTGAATAIGNASQGNIEALDFNGSTLVGVNFNDPATAFSINTGTAAASSIVTASSSTGVVRAGTIQSASTMLIRGDGGLGCSGNCLFSLNLGSGAVSLIGAMNANGGALIAALDFGADGLLYALDLAGQLYTVNTSTAALSSIGSASGIQYLGLATDSSSAVPEPATLSLLGGGLALAYFGRRRARGTSSAD